MNVAAEEKRNEFIFGSMPSTICILRLAFWGLPFAFTVTPGVSARNTESYVLPRLAASMQFTFSYRNDIRQKKGRTMESDQQTSFGDGEKKVFSLIKLKSCESLRVSWFGF